jgi:hypothetical protein
MGGMQTFAAPASQEYFGIWERTFEYRIANLFVGWFRVLSFKRMKQLIVMLFEKHILLEFQHSYER